MAMCGIHERDWSGSWIIHDLLCGTAAYNLVRCAKVPDADERDDTGQFNWTLRY